MIVLKISQRIAEESEWVSPFSGEAEVDECYFGTRLVRGKRRRGVSGNAPVLGLLKRNGNIYTEIVSDCKKATLQAIIRGRNAPETIIHSEGWCGHMAWCTSVT